MSLVSKLIATYRRFFPLHQFTAIVSVEIVTNKGSSGSKSKPPWQLCSFLLSHGRVESCPLFWRWTLKVISTWQTLSSKTSVCARSCWWASRCLAVHMDARGWPRVWLLRCFCSGAVYLDCLFFFLFVFVTGSLTGLELATQAQLTDQPTQVSTSLHCYRAGIARMQHHTWLSVYVLGSARSKPFANQAISSLFGERRRVICLGRGMSGSSERVELGGYDQDTHLVKMYKLSNSQNIKMFGDTALKTAHL